MRVHVPLVGREKCAYRAVWLQKFEGLLGGPLPESDCMTPSCVQYTGGTDGRWLNWGAAGRFEVLESI